MAEKINQAAAAAEEPEVKAKTKAKAKPAQVERPGVFVYIGPNLRGAIQESTIMSGKLIEIKARLAPMIAEHPQASALIVPMESLAECRRDVKTAGTLLHKKYMELLAE